MSKELTPLEALKDLRNYLDFVKTEKFSKTNLVRYFIGIIFVVIT